MLTYSSYIGNKTSIYILYTLNCFYVNMSKEAVFMICKKCGAYNPDHATFCKVCAANLKDQTDADEAAQATDAEEVVEKEARPRRGNVKAPDFSAARRASSYKAPQKVAEPEDHEDVDEEDYDEEEEEVKPAKKPLFSRVAAPAKKRRVVDDEDDEDEDDYDEDDYDEDDSDVKKLESEPKTTRFARSANKKSRVVAEDDEDDDEDDEDEDDGYDDDSYDDDEDDGYEEYEPTPPRRKKSSQSRGRKGGSDFNIVTILIACLLVILLIIVGIVAFCNIKGGDTKAKLPGFLQFNCAGKKAATQTSIPAQQATVPVDNQNTEPVDAPVTGTPVDYSVTHLEEIVDGQGIPCITISMTARPGDTVTIVLPNQDDFVQPNNEATDQPYLLTIPKSCFFPNTTLTDPVYTVTPQILVTHADGTQESLHVDSFDITFPSLQLEITEPAQADIPEEGIMAGEGNELPIKGKVDDHTVTVTINGQPVAIYEGGSFEYTYTLTGDEAETVLVEANKANCVSASQSFTVTPYVFIPEKMPLTVETAVDKLRADKNNKVTVTGVTAPGATLTATPAAEYMSSVACGSPTVDAEGNYSFEVTFGKDYYGIANITIHAKKDGYEEGETSCVVSRMYADRAKAISGYNKTNSYHEVPTGYAFAKVMENPTDGGFYRFVGKILEVDPDTGVITFEAKTSNKETVKIYVLNAVVNWDASKQVGKPFKLYSTLNGLYTDGTSLYITAWFQMKD